MNKLSLVLGILLLSLTLVGCSKGGSSNFVPNRGEDFLFTVEAEITNRTAASTEPRPVNVPFVFRNQTVDPLPVPGFTGF